MQRIVNVTWIFPPSYFYLKSFPEIINGNWGQWRIWTDCSEPCEGGTKTRTRFCNDPEVENGGDECTTNDSYVETVHNTGLQQQTASQTCNEHSCPGKQLKVSFRPISVDKYNIFSFKLQSTLFSSFIVYSLITDMTDCYLVTGGRPSRCVKTYVYSKSTCESSCTSLESCVGYSYSDFNYCFLHPSLRNCPYGFTYYSGTNMANTINDLAAGTESWSNSYSCYGRGSG